MTCEQIKHLIEQGIERCSAIVEGDGRHFQAVVVSPAFEGLSAVKKHQLVYRSLGDSMQSGIHALSIKTYTPREWEQARELRTL